jgi:hypothetical protein
MTLGVYHFVGNRPLDWGRGGPDVWPNAQPYLTPPGVQDQCGFYRFEWIDAIARRHAGMSLNQLVVAGGAALGAHDLPDRPPLDPLTHAERNLEIAQHMQDGQAPPYVLNSAFWLLAAAPGSAAAAQAWWPPHDEEPLPVVAQLTAWAAETRASTDSRGAATSHPCPVADHDQPRAEAKNGETPSAGDKPLEHYVLMPAPESLAAGYWSAVAEYVKAFRPACGFSPHEAAFARRVTIVAGEEKVPITAEADLRAAGCLVQRIASANEQALAQALRERVSAGEPYGPPTPFGHRPASES